MSKNLSIIEQNEENTNIKEALEDKEPDQKIELQLGDIIRIKDPTNEIINNHIFIIDYIDSEKIKLIEEKNLKRIQLKINSNGILNDGSINSIDLLYRNKNPGYAKQNNLVTGVWINIYFGGDIPTLLTGEITNLEEDMIEIRTFPDNNIIYINFDYKGIPEDLPIESIQIRETPETVQKEINKDIEATIPGVKNDISEEEVIEEDILDLGDELNLKPEIKRQINRPLKKIIEADNIEFGDYVDAIQEYVDIDKDKYRYNLETQANSLLNDLLSNIPVNQRTDEVLNNIHTMITRFIQLREIGSVFDKNKNIISILTKDANYKPLAEYLNTFKNKLYWLLLVAKNVKIIYDTKDNKDPEMAENSDVSLLETLENIEEMKELFNNYKSNSSIDSQNKYTELYSSLNPFLTPFLTINPEKNKNIICEHEVENDMDVVIDNLGDLYSSISARSQIFSKRFVIQKYNTGLTKLEANNLKGSKMISQRVNLTPNDIISIQSVLTLPEVTVRFSQINLPTSNILIKTNLNLHFLNYWELLKKNTFVNKISIDNLNTEIQYDENNFVDNIKNYLLEVNDDTLSEAEKYKKFLNIIVPKTKILFNLVKKYIKGKLTLVHLISYLEPFLIYSNDLTYMQYIEMNKFIKEHISEYNKAFVENSRRFSILKNIPKQDIRQSVLFEILNKNNDVKNIVFEKYGFKDQHTFTITNSELLKKIILDDYGNLYNTAIAFENIALMFPSELNAIFDLDKNKLNKSIAAESESNKCNNYIIAKKYTNKEDLFADNGKDIYFDKQYDTTPYNILDQYIKEQSYLSPEEFKLFLSDKLLKKYKYNTYDAEYIGDSLSNGFKKVLDSHYAVLINDNPSEQEKDNIYYVRKNNEWIKDNTIDPDIFITDSDALCLIQPKCLPVDQLVDSTCDSLKMTKDTIVSNALKEIMSQFDKNYDISKEELNNKLHKFLEVYTNLFDKIEIIHKYNFYKYNNKQYQYGLEEVEHTKIIQSPYNKLRDIILAQPDFLKKQNNIIRFTQKFTRLFNEDTPNINDGEIETKYWLYCKKTNTKLLPTFFYTLASVFIQNNSIYDETMNNIIKDQGVLSDDGGNWEDKYSGYVIKPIDWDVEEGYEGGFQIKSRDILDKDLGQTLMQNKKIRLNPQSQSIYNIIQSLSSFMGISIDNQSEFIINVVTNILNDTKVLMKETEYKKHVEEMAKKGKKIPEYNVVYNSTFLYMTLGMFLIGIQTSIPSLRTRKTFPGCVRSFNGFPIQGEGDYSGLSYLSCVVNKMKSPVSPWNILSKVKEDKISDNIKTFILKYLLPNYDVQQQITAKIDYLLLNPEEQIPEEHSLLIWNNFLPPLQKFKLKTIQNVTPGFTDELLRDIRMGLSNQIEKILVIETKIILYSFAIQEAIQKIVEKKNLLLKSSVHPYMDNACCNENIHVDKNITVLQYFIKDNREISDYNNIVKELSHFINDIQMITKASIFLSKVNTKRDYPSLSSDFNEETIYYAFIKYCKFNSFSPTPLNLLALCKEKPDFITTNDSIQEQIRKFKRDGINYSQPDLVRLLQIISNNNIINANTSLNEYTPIQRIRDLFEMLDRTNEDTIASSFRDLIDKVLDTYDISVTSDTEDMRKLKNYLDINNSKMKKQLLEFIKQKSKISTSEYKKIDMFINNISLWSFDNVSRNNISDDAMYNYIQFFKTFTTMLSKVYPNMILNQQIQTIQPPKYWGLSSKHSNDMKIFVESYYEPIKKFYGNNYLSKTLTEIQDKCKFIILLSKETPAFTNIKTGDNITYSVFDKRTSTLLFEYYLLQIFTSYIDLTDNPLMIKRVAPEPMTIDDELFDIDEDKLVTTEHEFLQGDTNQLKENISQLLVAYIKIMINTKKTIDVSYDSIVDKVFKLKEKEKDTFTDRLKSLTDEERNVDTILKINKLGVWNKGLMKGLKEYDPENYDQERDIMTKISEIEKKVRQNPDVDDQNVDIYMEDYINEMDAAEEIDEDVQLNESEDYMDGDYYGDEEENIQEYD